MMKRYLILALLFVFSMSAYGQSTEPVPVRISKEKANINGAIFYVHKVQPKQTVFSICKAYGVTTEELLNNNSTLKDGLKAGSIIFIPVTKQSIENTAAEAAANVAAADTVSAIDDKADKTEQSPDYKEHKVKWYETLNSIAKKYNVSVEDIVLFNKLSKASVETRQIIKIPLNTAKETEIVPEQKEVISEEDQSRTIVENYVERPMDEADALAKMEHLKSIDHFSERNPVRISIILPFNAQSTTPSSNYLDFYSGALLAVNQMKKDGLNISLNVIDLANHSWIGEIFQGNMLSGSNLVIGPVESRDIPEFANYCKLHKIPFVSPMDHKAEYIVENNRYFFQVPASVQTQLAHLIGNIKVDSHEKLTIMYNASGEEDSYVNNIKGILDNNHTPYNEIKYNILRGREITDSLKRVMSTNVRHKVIIASEDEAFASDAVRNMKVLSLSQVPITLYGSNKIRNYESIDAEFFNDLNMHTSAAYFVDYSSEETVKFLSRYRALFNTEPSPFAFQGYDILTYFLNALMDFGGNFIDYVTYYKMNLLQSNIQFVQIDGGGFVNKGIKEIEYLPDYSISVR